MGKLPGIMMYFDFRPAIDKLSFEQLGRLFAAMLNYGEFGEVPEFADPEMSMAWGFVARYVDNDRKRYEAKCERARARALKRWERDDEAEEEADEDTACTDAKTKTKQKQNKNIIKNKNKPPPQRRLLKNLWKATLRALRRSLRRCGRRRSRGSLGGWGPGSPQLVPVPGTSACYQSGHMLSRRLADEN